MADLITDVVSLKDENKDLRFEIEQQLNIIESQKQELYSANRKVETLSKMKIDMEIEIEALTGLHQIKGNLEAKVKSLEAELSSTRLKCATLETELQDTKTNHEVAIIKLTTEIFNIKNEQDQNQVSQKQNEDYLSELKSLREENKELNLNKMELQNDNKNLTDKTIMLEMSVSEKNQELEEMRNTLDYKSNDLKSAMKLIEELQEEKAMLSVELNSLKCHPVTANGKRGNSLFAEVDDKRISVANKYEVLQNKYKELKKNLVKKTAELKALEIGAIPDEKEKNNEIRKQWKEDEDAPYKSMASLLESHKVRIQELEHTISILEKRPENPQIISISEITNTQVECIKALVDNERQTNRNLRQEMEQRSLRELSQSEELFRLNQKIRTLNAQTMKDAAVISELKMKIEK
ncbi:hypothetical protein PGB90_009497 [Kerria lacca]